MSVPHHSEPGGAKENHSPSAQLKAAAEILEKGGGKPRVARRASGAGTNASAQRRRVSILTASDVNAARRLVKAKVRRAKREKIQRDQSKLNKTGISASCAGKKSSPRRI